MTLRAARGALLLLALACPVAAGTGQQAFDRQDFATAAALWRDEAAAGSVEAKFGLGLISDLGLGAPRDPAKAMRWYLEAAEAGLPKAQFNVAVMMDAGTGGARDAGAAAVWYARAAANRHARAAYNLGLLYEAGDGVPQNHDLARYWLGVAAPTLPAASQRLATLAPTLTAARSMAAPGQVSGALVPEGERLRAELVWSAPPGPAGTDFLVEAVRLPVGGDTWGTPVLSQVVQASALVASLPRLPEPVAWRVSRIDADRQHYAASPWQVLGPPAAGVPEGRVTIHVGAQDAEAATLAGEVGGSFWAGGLWVRIVVDTTPLQESGVRFRYAEDAPLARTVADFLPVLSGSDAQPTPDLDAAPGEIVVRLVGGPAQPESDTAPIRRTAAPAGP